MKYFFHFRYHRDLGVPIIYVWCCSNTSLAQTAKVTICVFQALFLDGTNSELAVLPNVYRQNKKINSDNRGKLNIIITRLKEFVLWYSDNTDYC